MLSAQSIVKKFFPQVYPLQGQPTNVIPQTQVAKDVPKFEDHQTSTFNSQPSQLNQLFASYNQTQPLPINHQPPQPRDGQPLAEVINHQFGINGFGRIGRTAFRVWFLKQKNHFDLKLINTSGSMEIEDWAHLLKYDSNYGVFQQEIKVNHLKSTKEVTDEDPVLGELLIADKKIIVTAQKDPAKIPWGKYGVETVIEATGIFNSEEKASAHLRGGAKNVILSAPPKGGNVSTSVIGVNQFDPGAKILANESCTTNCVAPVAKIIVEKLGVKKASLTTIHSYTDDQNTQDNSHKDLRRARTAAQNIIPTTTGAAIATTRVIPELKGLFDGLAVRVPTSVGSLSDMVFIVNRPTTIEEVNQILTDASKEDRFKGILAVTNDPIVSSDIIGRDESSIVDLSMTNVIDHDMVKIVSWYDNEWGYCCRLIEQIDNIR